MEQLQSLYQTIDVDVGQKALYEYIVRSSPVSDERIFFVIGLAAAHSGAFFGLNFFYGMLTRIMGKDIESIRFQPGKHAPPELVRHCKIYVTIWHMLAPLMPYLLYEKAVQWNPNQFALNAMPGIITILFQLVIAYICTDCLFYWGHRLLHVGPLYRWIHKQHHKFYVSIGFAAEYAHPIELLLCNVVPVVFAPVVFKYHYFVFCLWIAIAIMGTVSGHSGISSPFAEENGFHDFHHSANVGNYGSMPHWDRLFGTDKAWREHKAKLKAATNGPKAKPKSE